MKCNKTQNELIDYVYNQLSPEQSREFEQHVATCQECQTEMTELRQMHNLLSSVPDPQPMNRLVIETNRDSGSSSWANDVKKILPKSFWGKAFLSAAIVLISFLFVGSLFNLQIRYANGQFSMSMGLSRPVAESTAKLSDQQKKELLTDLHTENLKALQAMVQKSQQEQLHQIKEIMTNYAYALQQKQNNELEQMNQKLQNLYQHANQKFMQTDQVLSDIIQNTQYRK